MKDQDKYKEVDERFDKEFPIEDFCSAHSDYIPHNIKLFIHAYIDLAERRVVERIKEYLENRIKELKECIVDKKLYEGYKEHTETRYFEVRKIQDELLSSLKSENKNKDI
jgi:hypothetical protein